jgi:hypothetical protein
MDNEQVSHDELHLLLATRKLYILNFGRKLNQDILNDIQKKYKASVEEYHIKVNINLKKSIYIQCVDIINRIDTEILDGRHKIAVNPPGLPLVAMYLLTELHARIGIFPLVLELYRDKTEDPLFNDFKLRRIIDLERERQVSRSKLFEKE